MENHKFYWENLLFLRPFSIAMLVITVGYPRSEQNLGRCRCFQGLPRELAAALTTCVDGTAAANQIHEEDQREKGARSCSQRSRSLRLQAHGMAWNGMEWHGMAWDVAM